MEDLRAKAPWFVSGARTRHNSMPVLQIISEPSSEVLALIPYSDRTPKAHAECYADARLIAAAPELYEIVKMIRVSIDSGGPNRIVSFQDVDVAEMDAAIAKAEGR